MAPAYPESGVTLGFIMPRSFTTPSVPMVLNRPSLLNTLAVLSLFALRFEIVYPPPSKTPLYGNPYVPTPMAIQFISSGMVIFFARRALRLPLSSLSFSFSANQKRLPAFSIS